MKKIAACIRGALGMKDVVTWAMTVAVMTATTAVISAAAGGDRASAPTTRVQRLSADARELRTQFNADRAHARLLMLLSPT